MNRRDFLCVLGLTSSVIAVDPSLLTAPNRAVEIYRDYPELYFTGFRWAEVNVGDDDNVDYRARLHGQFLWTVEWEDIQGNKDSTYYYTNCALIPEDVTGINTYSYVTQRIQNSLLTVKSLIETSIEEAEAGTAYAFPMHGEPEDAFPRQRPIRKMKFASYPGREPWNHEIHAARAIALLERGPKALEFASNAERPEAIR